LLPDCSMRTGVEANGKLWVNAPMTFKYRYVGFGTNFEFAAGLRFDRETNPRSLHANEIALDVGNVCWGYNGEPLAVIDHHFERPGQFSSASAAVLHNSELIGEKFGTGQDGLIWLVTHVQPDFDAFCSMYLARAVIERNFGAGSRWPTLLADYASHVDSGRRIVCPKHRALHSVLYAALLRGRAYLSETSGATEFFEHAKEAIEKKGLNPLFDSIFEGSDCFRPELALLDHEMEAYDRDLRRARKAIVHLQKLEEPFQEFFERVKEAPLVDDGLAPTAPHIAPLNQRRSQADGIYLKDPECLLFKEWARLDLENSSMGMGFTFTAVAYSGGRPDGAANKSDYFFAIDPERADHRCLYSLWARLEAAEIRALHQPEHEGLKARLEGAERDCERTSRRTRCRIGFEGRAGKYKALFDDPWFDGSNYESAIIATPNRGTLIGPPGARADLLDDPVAAIARHELEHSIYASLLTLVDLSASSADPDGDELLRDIAEAMPPPPERCFRFARIELNSGVETLAGHMAAQIGEALWRALHPGAAEGVPTDFLTRHLLVARDWVAVWSRRGIAVAFKPAAEREAKELEARFRDLVKLARGVEGFIESGSRPLSETLAEGEELARMAARMSHELALPENRLLSRFFEALGLRELLASLRDLNQAAAGRERTEEMIRHTKTVATVQRKVELLEIFIVGFYVTELAKIIADGLKSGDWVIPVVAGPAGMAAAVLLLRPWKH
jgi:hypothetical protein